MAKEVESGHNSTMTLEEGYKIVGAGFHDRVFIVNGGEIRTEYIFSGLSLYDAVQHKLNNRLFLTWEEAKDERDRLLQKDKG